MNISFVGAGIGSLYAALLWTHKHPSTQVTIYEKEDRVGGRLNYVEFENGARIDEGPTIVLLPSKLKSQLQEAGFPEQELELLEVDPLYRLRYEDGTTFHKYHDIDRQAEEIERFFGEGDSFRRYMGQKREEYKIGFDTFLNRGYKGKTDLFEPRLLMLLMRLKAYESAHENMKRFFKDERLRVAYSLQTLYIGGNPYETPSLYGLIPYREQEEGIWYVRGGYFSLATKLEQELKKRGVTFKLNSPVDRVRVQDGRANAVVVDGVPHPYDAVIVNGDFPLMERLIDGIKPKAYEPSSGTLLLYFTVDGEIELPVHQFDLPNDFAGSMRTIFEDGKLSKYPAMYTFNPSLIDSTLAPVGTSVLYVLVPVPRKLERQDFEQSGAIEHLVSRIEGMVPKFRDRVIEMKVRTPMDAERFGLFEGGSFGIAPKLSQSAAFKPQARPYAQIERLYAVGASVHPCGGVPIVMIGSQLLVKRMEEEMGALYHDEARSVSSM
ncbi:MULTISPECIES: NAD(P)/FAD-dependent oxidoreductase [unclassified Exiguobacterium]|uniref:phytoene desaturase family protein n=1 Tax=unclassified Exiguobacterium TaxID=2644629 RepID=UPI00103B5421|nr:MULTISPECIES: phytoene desaturase family protein [unclassified Exiguobacterium]TCI43255.1 phytoene desaturase [Exiguobacterium sp. SH5S32]TCI49976.1 phytoene desaturase [Exiguobacterium sp. SH1S4]TCI65834.1 phytoene desaturase [Exiguobacterium sp. SH0S2]TCI68377.1 phytoene desaturase [Exiguobacterium sp. SH1S1]